MLKSDTSVCKEPSVESTTAFESQFHCFIDTQSEHETQNSADYSTNSKQPSKYV